MKNLNNIGFDIDGVFCDFNDIFVKSIKEKFNIDVSKNEEFVKDLPNISNKKFMEFVEEVVIKNIYNFKAYDNSVEYLKKFYYNFNKKNPLVFITSRPVCVKNETIKWIKTNLGDDINFDILFVDNKDKTKACKECGIKYFVEDRLDNALSMLNDLNEVFLIDRVWNTKNRPNKTNLHIAKDLKEVYDFMSTKYKYRFF